MPHMNPKTTPSTAVHKPITTVTGARTGGKQRNEIFVDIIERLNVLFSPNGYVLNSNIDGCIQMKSYLSGQPELRLALNEDLVVGTAGNFGTTVLDDCNFHDCVNLEEFESGRILSFHPPDGEFSVLNYRITAEFRAPFRVFPNIEGERRRLRRRLVPTLILILTLTRKSGRPRASRSRCSCAPTSRRRSSDRTSPSRSRCRGIRRRRRRSSAARGRGRTRSTWPPRSAWSGASRSSSAAPR
mmetsp:Transcript_28921/g.92428  ORF Transcript_28921/g.92428 Transcript_28921/m.92428 type:complete len:242 (-) Transcript_28921:268-993(-)